MPLVTDRQCVRFFWNERKAEGRSDVEAITLMKTNEGESARFLHNQTHQLTERERKIKREI